MSNTITRAPQGKLITFPRPILLCVLAALNVTVVSFFVLWSNADTAAVNRAEEHGFDPSQLLPHATPLILGIDRNHVNLAHLVLGVDACADPSDRVLTLKRNRHILRLLIEYFLQIVELPLLPPLRVERIIDELGDVVVHPRKNGSPGAK